MKMYAIVDLLEYKGNIWIVYQLDYKEEVCIADLLMVSC